MDSDDDIYLSHWRQNCAIAIDRETVWLRRLRIIAPGIPPGELAYTVAAYLEATDLAEIARQALADAVRHARSAQ